MILDEFSLSGFSTLSKFFLIETKEQAQTLDEFIGCEDISEAFTIAGPGTYYILFDKGWNRAGDYAHTIIKKVPEKLETPNEFLHTLMQAQKVYDKEQAPFALARDVRTNKDCATLSDEDKQTLSGMSTKALMDAQQAIDDILEGY